MSWSAKSMLCLMLITLLTGCDKPSPSRISTRFNAQEIGDIAYAPYLLPMCFDAGEPHDLNVVIKGVGTGGVKITDCTIAHDENNLDFALRWPETQIVSKRAWVAEVNVRAKNIFSDKSENRDQLKKSFRAFQLLLSALEEDENNGCLAKGDTQIISQHVADALPLRLDEILAYKYGFNSNDRVIDLKAGMRLRIEQGAYQFIDDDASEGYVGRGSSYLQIIRRPDQTLAFDPFLGALKAVKTDPPYLPDNRMISGAMGLAAAGVSRRYARLVYPSQYPTTENTTAVQAEDELPMRVGLLLADNAQDLETATEMFIDDSRCAANENNSVMCFYFSGRSFVIPEVLVTIQGVDKYVSIGTTLRDALNRSTGASIKQIGDISTRSYSPELLRWRQPGLCQDKAGYQSTGILFELASPITESTLSQWDIPLLMGDELRW